MIAEAAIKCGRAALRLVLLCVIGFAAEHISAADGPHHAEFRRMQMDLSLKPQFIDRLERVPLEQQSISDISLAAFEVALEDNDWRIRRRAANCAQILAERFPGDRRPVEALLRAVRIEHEVTVLIEVIRALGDYREPEAVDPLLILFRKRDPFWFHRDEPREQLEPPVAEALATDVLKAVCRAVEQIGDRRAIPVLRKRLTEARPYVVTALGALRDEESLPDFLSILRLEDTTVQQLDVAIAAARATSSIADESCVGELIAALQRTDYLESVGQTQLGDLQRALCSSLAKTEHPEAAAELFRFALQSDWTRKGQPPRAVSAVPGAAGVPLTRMGRIALHEATRRLKSCSSNCSELREFALWVLAALGKQERWLPLDRETLVPIVVACLDDASLCVRCESLELVESLRLVDALPQIEQLVRDNSEDDPLLERVAFTLKGLRDPRGATLAARLLNHTSIRVRCAAIGAVVATQHPQAVDLLVPLLNSEVWHQRQLAASELARLPDPRVARALLDLAAHERGQTTREAVFRSLAVLGVTDARSILRERVIPFRNTTGAESMLAVPAVSLCLLDDELGSEIMQEQLQKGLGPRTIFVGHHLREMLELMRSETSPRPIPQRFFEVLRTAVDQRVRDGRPRSANDSATVEAALHALSWDSDNATTDLYRRLLANKDHKLRLTVIECIGHNLRDARQELLLNAALDAQPEVRAAAMMRLAESGVTLPDNLLSAALDDADADVRSAALRHLLMKSSIVASSTVRRLATSDKSPRVRDLAQAVLKQAAR